MSSSATLADHAASIRQMEGTEGGVPPGRLRIDEGEGLEVYYGPFEHVRPGARIVVVGITPGARTYEIALRTARERLRAGDPYDDVLRAVKSTAPFSQFRPQLIRWFDELAIPPALGLSRAQQLWSPGGESLFQPTSAVRNPVFAGGKNYSGSRPNLEKSPMLMRHVRATLVPELALRPQALVVPLGVRVEAALRIVSGEGAVDPDRVLFGFPHPSGNNGHRHKQWRENVEAMRRKVAAWG